MSAPNDEEHAGAARNPYEPPKAENDLPLQQRRDRSGQTGSTGRRPAPAAQFSIDCPCGRAITVAASQAGSTVRCGCGAEVRVPSLGRLRELSGRDRYESGICDTIRRMVQSGELPVGGTCAVSREPTDDVIDLEILVPRFFRNRDDVQNKTLWIFGVWGALYLALFSRPQIEEEGTLTVRLPLRVAGSHHHKVRAMSQRRLRRLLRKVPAYARLLEENPYSRLSVADRPA
jgi:hypothetical protein